MSDIRDNDELARLRELHEKGILTDAEYQDRLAEVDNRAAPKGNTAQGGEERRAATTQASLLNAFSNRKGIVGGGVALALVAILYLVSSNALPDCGDQETKDLVFQIVQKNIVVQLLKPLSSSFDLEAIRQQSRDAETGAYTCAATLTFEFQAEGIQQMSRNITYTIEKTVTADEYYVTVYGF